ncbi:hypothetical protein N665_0049s0010 [Sinapis alba]|nr:hypothetical protein N665_0049s0010 [Sinapis alba]
MTDIGGIYKESQDITEVYFSMPSFPRAPIIESLRLKFCLGSLQPEEIKLCVSIAVSRCLRVLSISCFPTTNLIVHFQILVDVPPTDCLPCLKTLQLLYVTHFSEDSLRLLLSYCPVLENLIIERDTTEDNVKGLVVAVPSLKRLSLRIGFECSCDVYVIDTPSLKYFKVEDYRESFSYLIKHIPKLEEADITVRKIFKRLSLQVLFYNEEESDYGAGIIFNQLEHLKLSICSNYWSKLIIRFLKDSPNLRVLNLKVAYPPYGEYKQINWDDEWRLLPNCLLKT